MKLHETILALSRPVNSDPVKDFFVADRPVVFRQSDGTEAEILTVRFKADGTILVMLK